MVGGNKVFGLNRGQRDGPDGKKGRVGWDIAGFNKDDGATKVQSRCDRGGLCMYIYSMCRMCVYLCNRGCYKTCITTVCASDISTLNAGTRVYLAVTSYAMVVDCHLQARSCSVTIVSLRGEVACF